MAQDILTDRELELVHIVGTEFAASQRELSRHMDLSLGAINMLLRRLVAKGYIRIEQLNKKRVRYLLTPKGFSEKMRQSLTYTVKTIRSISVVKERLQHIVRQLYGAGERNFYIIGDSDLGFLMENAVREMGWPDCRVVALSEMPREPIRGRILLCKENVLNGGPNEENCLNVITELARDQEFLAFSRN